jgi:hypothetical protein
MRLVPQTSVTQRFFFLGSVQESDTSLVRPLFLYIPRPHSFALSVAGADVFQSSSTCYADELAQVQKE